MEAILMYAMIKCSVNDTFVQVKANNPRLSVEYAERLSKSICKSATRHGVPPMEYTAILMQESAYKLNAVNKRSNDYGIAQINEYNIRAWKMSKKRLLGDLEYSVDQGAFILSWFYKTYRMREPDTWLCRYNVGVKPMKGVTERLCLKYYNKVQRFFY